MPDNPLILQILASFLGGSAIAALITYLFTRKKTAAETAEASAGAAKSNAEIGSVKAKSIEDLIRLAETDSGRITTLYEGQRLLEDKLRQSEIAGNAMEDFLRREILAAKEEASRALTAFNQEVKHSAQQDEQIRKLEQRQQETDKRQQDAANLVATVGPQINDGQDDTTAKIIRIKEAIPAEGELEKMSKAELIKLCLRVDILVNELLAQHIGNKEFTTEAIAEAARLFGVVATKESTP